MKLSKCSKLSDSISEYQPSTLPTLLSVAFCASIYLSRLYAVFGCRDSVHFQQQDVWLWGCEAQTWDHLCHCLPVLFVLSIPPIQKLFVSNPQSSHPHQTKTPSATKTLFTHHTHFPPFEWEFGMKTRSVSSKWPFCDQPCHCTLFVEKCITHSVTQYYRLMLWLVQPNHSMSTVSELQQQNTSKFLTSNVTLSIKWAHHSGICVGTSKVQQNNGD